MVKTRFKPKKILYKRIRKSHTVPNQSLTLNEIMTRYVRGIPVDVVKRESVYLDQSDYDFEAMSRMDFAEKAELAAAMKEQAAQIEQQLKDDERAERERKIKAAREQALADLQRTGIDPLDNTMPVDTKHNIK